MITPGLLELLTETNLNVGGVQTVVLAICLVHGCCVLRAGHTREDIGPAPNLEFLTNVRSRKTEFPAMALKMSELLGVGANTRFTGCFGTRRAGFHHRDVDLSATIRAPVPTNSARNKSVLLFNFTESSADIAQDCIGFGLIHLVTPFVMLISR
ncbi:hypothetical protein RsoM2USA_106 [Ralstonia phage RsoM2USA]|nr:hypothetical protein RsoM2USA_106 [Ralstonia phage RsoM2USA]